MPPHRRLAALARAATGGAVAALTDAAARKAQELWLASAAYVGAVDLAFEGRSYDVVRATVMVSPVTSVRVVLRRASPESGARVECTCRKPLDLGMPCKHALAVFRALDHWGGDFRTAYNRLDKCWFSDVWHSTTLVQQYDVPFVTFEVREQRQLSACGGQGVTS